MEKTTVWRRIALGVVASTLLIVSSGIVAQSPAKGDGASDTGAKGADDPAEAADSTQWEQVLGEAPWEGRGSHASVVFRDKLWMLGGGNSGGPLNDIWSTADGAVWVQEFEGTPVPLEGKLEEARAAMGVIKDRARVHVARFDLKADDNPPSIEDLGMKEDLDGAFFAASDYSTQGTVEACTIACQGVFPDEPTELTLEVNLLNGQILKDFSDKNREAAQPAGASMWSRRGLHAAAVFQDRIWVIGGLVGMGEAAVRNDVWSSADGVAWRQDARARHKNEAGRAAEAREKILLLKDRAIKAYKDHRCVPSMKDRSMRKGLDGDFFGRQSYEISGTAEACVIACKGVYAEAPTGVALTVDLNTGETVEEFSDKDRAPEASPHWSARAGHRAVAFRGRLWVLGGFSFSGDDYNWSARAENDVWSSADGATWEEHAATGEIWQPRVAAGVVVFQDRIWVMGGLGSQGVEFGSGPRDDDGDGEDDSAGSGEGPLNDVWCSADGVNWTLVAETAPWSPRQGHSAVVHDGRMWVMGGTATNHSCNDVWSSVDGVDWKLETKASWWCDLHRPNNPLTRDARVSEATAAMGVIKDRARVVVQRKGLRGGDDAPAIDDLGLGSDLDGAYFSTQDYSMSGKVKSCKITCKGVYTERHGSLNFTVNLLNGKVLEELHEELPFTTAEEWAAHRVAEAKAGIEEIRDRARMQVQLDKSGPDDAGPTLADLDLGEDLDGVHFETDAYEVGGTAGAYKITCRGVYPDGDLTLTVNLLNGAVVEEFNERPHGVHWSPRMFHAAASFQGRLWVFGGAGDDSEFGDVWATKK